MGTNLAEAVLHLPSDRRKEKEVRDTAMALLERVGLGRPGGRDLP
jgi:ABC-type branched-subunit amino acid transport system ATPase component